MKSSMEFQQVAIIAIIGAGAGLLSGLLGLGGAIVIIPALVLFLGYSQQMAQGTALMMMVLPVGALAAFQYYQKGYVDIKVALIMAVFFFAGGYFGAKFATQIPQDILKKVFSLLLVVIAVKMWLFDKH
ncbi:MAG: sulfite exporter TauE/SafE family protein [Chitinophagales bacterium]